MVIVTGSIRARRDSIDEVLRLSLEHVHRSRMEPGCLLHTVHRDVEDDLRVVFLEHWSTRESLQIHFALPASGDFVQAVRPLAVDTPEIDIYEAERVRL